MRWWSSWSSHSPGYPIQWLSSPSVRVAGQFRREEVLRNELHVPWWWARLPNEVYNTVTDTYRLFPRSRALTFELRPRAKPFCKNRFYLRGRAGNERVAGAGNFRVSLKIRVIARYLQLLSAPRYPSFERLFKHSISQFAIFLLHFLNPSPRFYRVTVKLCTMAKLIHQLSW